MAISWVDVCNMAILKAGGNTINSLDEGSTEARTCKLLLEQVRQDVLSSFPWNMAVAWASNLALAGESGGAGKPRWPFRYAYALPGDCLRVLGVKGREALGRGCTEPFATGRHASSPLLLTDVDNPDMAYITDVPSADALSPRVRDIIIYQLASEISIPLSESTGRARSFLELAEMARHKAMLTDAAEGFDMFRSDGHYLAERAGAESFGPWDREPWSGVGEGGAW